MCYSAMVRQEHSKYVREFGASIGIEEYVRLFWNRTQEGSPSRIPKAMEQAFAQPVTDEEREIARLIDVHHARHAAAVEAGLFKQKKRLADAQRTLLTKTTKKVQDDVRIATSKIERGLATLSDLHRTQPAPQDSRIYPGYYAPVMVREDGRRVVKPMRYQCRVCGVPAAFDSKYPGTYNARRDSLEKYWRRQFGVTHGLVLASAFYEHVQREGRDVVLEFKPDTQQEMLVACLWSRWTGDDGEELLSFAAITDEPPPEVVAAGHDRCIIPIRRGDIDTWLDPDPSNLAALYAVLDRRERPYFEHRMAG